MTRTTMLFAVTLPALVSTTRNRPVSLGSRDLFPDGSENSKSYEISRVRSTSAVPALSRVPSTVNAPVALRPLTFWPGASPTPNPEQAYTTGDVSLPSNPFVVHGVPYGAQFGLDGGRGNPVGHRGRRGRFGSPDSRTIPTIPPTTAAPPPIQIHGLMRSGSTYSASTMK